MLQGTKRRLAMLERSIELPLTAERVLALVEERVRLTGASRNDVIDAMAASMTSVGTTPSVRCSRRFRSR